MANGVCRPSAVPSIGSRLPTPVQRANLNDRQAIAACVGLVECAAGVFAFTQAGVDRGAHLEAGGLKLTSRCA